MSDTIVVAIITAVASTLGSMSLVNWRLKSIEKRLEEHNGYAQKFADSSKDISLIQQDIGWIKKALTKSEVI